MSPFGLGKMLRETSAPKMGGKQSEEHTSELQSRLHLVCRLLLEKKKTITITILTLTSKILLETCKPESLLSLTMVTADSVQPLSHTETYLPQTTMQLVQILPRL